MLARRLAVASHHPAHGSQRRPGPRRRRQPRQGGAGARGGGHRTHRRECPAGAARRAAACACARPRRRPPPETIQQRGHHRCPFRPRRPRASPPAAAGREFRRAVHAESGDGAGARATPSRTCAPMRSPGPHRGDRGAAALHGHRHRLRRQALARRQGSRPPRWAASSRRRLGGSRFQIGRAGRRPSIAPGGRPPSRSTAWMGCPNPRHLPVGLPAGGRGLPAGSAPSSSSSRFPVTVGFTAGIAVIIFASQIKDLLGSSLSGPEPGPLLQKFAVLWHALPHAGRPGSGAVASAWLAIIVGLKQACARTGPAC